MTKILTVVGARPQFIKAAMLSHEISRRNGVQEIMVHTGQHYDSNMSGVFFDELGIPEPHYNLGVGACSHGEMTGRQLQGIEGILMEEKPDIVVVYGDTNSTMAGCLAAAKLNIPVAHVEAGLRSFNRRMPEEINRILTDHAATWLFAPSQTAMSHMANEGFGPDRAFFVGDITYDAALHYGAIADQKSDILKQLDLEDKPFRISTIHRPENTGFPKRMDAIFGAFRSLAEEAALVLPLHPGTRKVLQDQGLLEEFTRGLTIIEPVGFLDMLRLTRASSLVLTDSGGVQKEAYFHGSPAVILRDETEWSELVTLGWAALVPPINSKDIFDAAKRMDGVQGDSTDKPYGDGTTAAAIMDTLLAA